MKNSPNVTFALAVMNPGAIVGLVAPGSPAVAATSGRTIPSNNYHCTTGTVAANPTAHAVGGGSVSNGS